MTIQRAEIDALKRDIAALPGRGEQIADLDSRVRDLERAIHAMETRIMLLQHLILRLAPTE